DAGDIVAHEVTFASVDAGADIDADVIEPGDKRRGATDAHQGPVEGRQDAVASLFDHTATVALDLLSSDAVVVSEQCLPALGAKGGGRGGRVDEVGEQHGRERPR